MKLPFATLSWQFELFPILPRVMLLKYHKQHPPKTKTSKIESRITIAQENGMYFSLFDKWYRPSKNERTKKKGGSPPGSFPYDGPTTPKRIEKKKKTRNFFNRIFVVFPHFSEIVLMTPFLVIPFTIATHTGVVYHSL